MTVYTPPVVNPSDDFVRTNPATPLTHEALSVVSPKTLDAILESRAAAQQQAAKHQPA